MSKAKGKEKKGDNKNEDAQLIDQQKRQILEQTFTIRRLQDRISRMTQENYDITTNKDKVQQQYQERIDKQRIIIESHENNIKENRAKIYDFQVNKMTLESRVGDLERQLRQQQQQKTRQFDEYKRFTQNQITKLELQLRQYNMYMNERDGMNSQNSNLKLSISNEKEERVREVADKQREKVQAIDRLRDQMLTKIKDMRSNLLSLKKQQLDTTTRLAVLQNHQLTSQLQFQSKQSQKLIFQNEQLTKKVSNLQKDLQIHRQIEQQLAKRSHYSRGIIKKLTAKIAQLQHNLKEAGEMAGSNQSALATAREDASKEEVIRSLDRSLENTQKKFLKLQSESEMTKNQFNSIRSKLQNMQKKTTKITQILIKAYSSFEDGSLQIRQHGYQIDLGQLRKKSLQQWSHSQLRLVINALIQQLSSMLTSKNMNLPSPLRAQQVSILDSDEAINNVRLPKIGEHSTNSKLELSMKLKELPVSLGSKLVGSHIRQWGRSVHSSSQANLIRKYKVYDK